VKPAANDFRGTEMMLLGNRGSLGQMKHMDACLIN